jgi:hypothetical protein
VTLLLQTPHVDAQQDILGATHVGMYVGAGLMVHAPRPGRHVTTAKADSLPLLGAVRPPAPAK